MCTVTNDHERYIAVRRSTRAQGDDTPVSCSNCGVEEYSVEQYHVHLDSGRVLEMELCEGCRSKFVTADWVEAVLADYDHASC